MTRVLSLYLTLLFPFDHFYTCVVPHASILWISLFLCINCIFVLVLFESIVSLVTLSSVQQPHYISLNLLTGSSRSFLLDHNIPLCWWLSSASLSWKLCRVERVSCWHLQTWKAYLASTLGARAWLSFMFVPDKREYHRVLACMKWQSTKESLGRLKIVTTLKPIDWRHWVGGDKRRNVQLGLGVGVCSCETEELVNLWFGVNAVINELLGQTRKSTSSDVFALKALSLNWEVVWT